MRRGGRPGRARRSRRRCRRRVGCICSDRRVVARAWPDPVQAKAVADDARDIDCLAVMEVGAREAQGRVEEDATLAGVVARS